MTDTDILLRLRAAIHMQSARLAPQTSPEIELMREAAEEIERMRGLPDRLRVLVLDTRGDPDRSEFHRGWGSCSDMVTAAIAVLTRAPAQ